MCPKSLTGREGSTNEADETGEFRASIAYILPEEWRHLIERKKLKLRTGAIEFNGNGTGEANREVPKKSRRRPEPLGGKARFLT
jgi:hypothetical protein